ncbi:hypothetical protein BpHYR1_007166 [Brachionus plicatilis]|uniref:Uncharacterized protein n=1 Tax=Brachionus plicatilis TaxID=10195 RepID=A0A3M7S749_BRAPC|nr:hypothetical protein BpHYR1_007166 [Brachionus plicatilis]
MAYDDERKGRLNVEYLVVDIDGYLVAPVGCPACDVADYDGQHHFVVQYLGVQDDNYAHWYQVVEQECVDVEELQRGQVGVGDAREARRVVAEAPAVGPPAGANDGPGHLVRAERGRLQRVLDRQVPVHAQHHQDEHARALAQVHCAEVDLAEEEAEEPAAAHHSTQQDGYEEQVEKVGDGQVEQIEVGHVHFVAVVVVGADALELVSGGVVSAARVCVGRMDHSGVLLVRPLSLEQNGAQQHVNHHTVAKDAEHEYQRVEHVEAELKIENVGLEERVQRRLVAQRRQVAAAAFHCWALLLFSLNGSKIEGGKVGKLKCQHAFVCKLD